MGLRHQTIRLPVRMEIEFTQRWLKVFKVESYLLNNLLVGLWPRMDNNQGNDEPEDVLRKTMVIIVWDPWNEIQNNTQK